MEGVISEITTIDEYIRQFRPDVQVKLNALRKVIHETAPDAQEKISWGMPTFVLHGNLIHFAAHKKHIGLYPGASGIESFKSQMTEYQTSKGAVQFPFEKPLPFDLIREIVRFRVTENLNDSEKKRGSKK